jgi:hypothetical protein
MKRTFTLSSAALLAALWTASVAAQGAGTGARSGAPAQGRGRAGTPIAIGPSAPVPPEVAIPRPTADELAQVNAAVKKFIDTDRSSVRPLLKKLPIARIKGLCGST